MLQKMLFGHTPDILLGKMLDKAALSQRVISSNVANAATPGYQRMGVSFDEELVRAVAADRMPIKRTSPKHMPDPNWVSKIEPEVVEIEDGYWNGINNVDMEREMVDLSKAQLDFNMASDLLNSRFTGLRTAIRGRR